MVYFCADVPLRTYSLSLKAKLASRPKFWPQPRSRPQPLVSAPALASGPLGLGLKLFASALKCDSI